MDMTTKAGATPRLRFPEYREGPAWSEVKLGELVTTVTPPAKLQTSSYMAAGAFPIVDQSQDQFCGWTDDARAVINEPLPLVVFGDHTCALKIVRQPFAQGADGIKILRANNTVDADFLFQSLSHHPLEPEDYKRHFSTLKERRVLFPDIKSGEQQKVAECLTSLDDVIAAQARKVEALKAHKRGLMQQLFPREGETVPRLRFPEFHDAPDWEPHRLADFVSALDAGVSVNSGDRPAQPGEFGVLKTSAVSEGVFDVAENKVVLEASERERARESVRADTIIISRMNTPALVGANAYVEKGSRNIFLPDRLWAAKGNGRGNMRYLSYLLGSPKGRLSLSQRATGTSGSMKNISKPAVLELEVMAPGLREQEQVAGCLASLDAQISAAADKLNGLRQHKLGLMRQLFPVPEGRS